MPHASQLLINELEAALQSGSSVKRTELLRRVTDLFLQGANSFSPDQVALFDEVMTRAVTYIESKVLCELSGRLAPLAKAPAGVVRRLAWDDDIQVSGPMLQHSERLSDDQLVEIAKAKSQDHLMQISGRHQLNTAVTDILVERGNTTVQTRVAANPGARLSEDGLSKLALCAEADEELLLAVAARTDMPPLLLRHVLAAATDTVREKLLTQARPEMREAIRRTLKQVSDTIGSITPLQYADAQRQIDTISHDTALTKRKVMEFAAARRLPETIVALATLCALPIDLADHLANRSGHFGVMLLCRAIGLEWPVAEAMLRAKQSPTEPFAAAELQSQYEQLSVSSAQRLLRYWQARQGQATLNDRRSATPTPSRAA